MQNAAQTINQPLSGRLLGFVRVVVGGHVVDLAVQAINFDKDSDQAAGGFFVQDGEIGILVDDAAEGPQVQAQIEKGTAEAVRHLSQKFLN